MLLHERDHARQGNLLTFKLRHFLCYARKSPYLLSCYYMKLFMLCEEIPLHLMLLRETVLAMQGNLIRFHVIAHECVHAMRGNPLTYNAIT
jgi:hypothetical protein